MHSKQVRKGNDGACVKGVHSTHTGALVNQGLPQPVKKPVHRWFFDIMYQVMKDDRKGKEPTRRRRNRKHRRADTQGPPATKNRRGSRLSVWQIHDGSLCCGAEPTILRRKWSRQMQQTIFGENGQDFRVAGFGWYLSTQWVCSATILL